MKRIKFIFNCVTNLIKKKIFKSQKTDISQECEKVLRTSEEFDAIKELKLTDEYLLKYNRTTRWQTL